MPPLPWILGGAAIFAAIAITIQVFGRTARARATVLEEVRRSMKGGVIERAAGRGQQARGRFGELEVTVDLQRDPTRPRQSPMWRVLAVGPVAMERPIEAHIGGWTGWIDPWLQLGETLMMPRGVGPEITLHAERTPSLEHPMIAALRRQGESLGPGALHARPDLMRVETRFQPRAEDNRALFAYLHAMVEIAERPGRSAWPAERTMTKRFVTGGGK